MTTGDGAGRDGELPPTTAEGSTGRTSAPRLGIFAEVVCPFTHVSLRQLARVRGEDGVDVADPEAVATIGARFGVEPLGAAAAEAAVRADWEEGRARRVQGSPHFFFGDRAWVCPTLDIREPAEHRYEVRIGPAGQRDFFDAVFAS
jgi:hypothetical protein